MQSGRSTLASVQLLHRETSLKGGDAMVANHEKDALPSRDDIEARLLALKDRLPSRRETDQQAKSRMRQSEAEATTTLVRLAALEARLRTLSEE